jgi:hypothetical protein
VRFFVIQDSTESPVAVVFHDHRDQVVYCRSLKASFLSAFDAVCAKHSVTFSKEDSGSSVLRALDRGIADYNWISDVLADLCNDYWHIAERGDLIHSEVQVDSVAGKYLS